MITVEIYDWIKYYLSVDFGEYDITYLKESNSYLINVKKEEITDENRRKRTD